MIIHPTVLAQELANAWLSSPTWNDTLTTLRSTYQQRSKSLLDALTSCNLPDVTWTKPEGGFFTWLTVTGMDPDTDIQHLALKHGVALIPGRAFFSSAPSECNIRLAFSNSTLDQLATGAERLAAMLQEQGDGKTR